MRSMTGYGRGFGERGGRRVAAEIRAVNHRFLDLKLRGAGLDAGVEETVQARVRAAVSRGSLTVTLRVEGSAASNALQVDVAAARRVLTELRALCDTLHLPRDVPLSLLVGQPGVLVPAEPEGSTEDLAAAAVSAVDEALADLVAMRETEGATLLADMRARLERLAALAGELEGLARTAPEEAQRRLEERVHRLLGGGASVEVDDASLAREVAVLADRLDVTEELVRARSHIDQLHGLMKTGDSVGRRLDFLVQELGREFNTITSKSQSADIARLVVEAKAELEKIREQVQNIE